jgi:LPXTG-site transpeptidase (sortase) family protein
MQMDGRRETSPLRGRWVLIAAGAILAVVVAAVAAVGSGTMDGLGIGSGSRFAGPEFGNAAVEGAAPAFADDIRDLVAEYGEPPDATFARIRIPKLGIDAGVSPRYVDGAVMPNPDGPENVAWYDMSQYPGMGGVPGAGRNAIFGAHVDFNNYVQYADRHFRGPAIFYSLDHLVPGDTIEIEYEGETLTYQVSWAEELDAASADWASIWSDNVPTDSITLFTCGGTFDREAHSYSHRYVVRAERA